MYELLLEEEAHLAAGWAADATPASSTGSASSRASRSSASSAGSAGSAAGSDMTELQVKAAALGRVVELYAGSRQENAALKLEVLQLQKMLRHREQRLETVDGDLQRCREKLRELGH